MHRWTWPLAAGLILTASAAAGSSGDAQTGPAVRLTSPLGRTGFTGTIRVVAQVITPAPGGVIPVRFFVDGKLLAEDTDGAPYVTEWEDENPYEPRVISAEVDDGRGGVVRDRVSLAPLEVIEESSVASVLVEAIVTDPAGHAISTLAAEDFSLFEDGVPQTLDLAQLQRLPTPVHAARRRQPEHVATHRPGAQDCAAAGEQAAKRRHGGCRAFCRTVDASPARPTTRRRLQTPSPASAPPAARLSPTHWHSCRTSCRCFEGRQVVILVTDGYDEHSEKPLDRRLDALQRLHATVYVVGIGGVAGISLKGELLLRRIAAQMGGRAFFPSREEQLPDVHGLDRFRDLQPLRHHLHADQSGDPNGTYRAIRLSRADDTHTVKARAGYFAPKPPPIRPTLEFSVTATAQENDFALAAADLTVIEDGVEQRIESFQEANAPMSIVMSLDASGSIRPALEAVKDAALTFITALRADDSLALVQFSDAVVFAHDFTTKRQTSSTPSPIIAPWGGRRCGTPCMVRWRSCRSKQGRRAVVVVTDGRDENNPGTGPGSAHTAAEVLAQVQDSNTTVYAIGLGARVDREALQRIADASGEQRTFRTT